MALLVLLGGQTKRGVWVLDDLFVCESRLLNADFVLCCVAKGVESQLDVPPSCITHPETAQSIQSPLYASP